MKNWVSIAITAVVALAVGYLLRPAAPKPIPVTKIAPVPTTVAPLTPKPVTVVASAPPYPKPSLEPPVPSEDETAPSVKSPEPLIGNFPALPRAGSGGPSGTIGPLAPAVPTKLPAADLNADEALARRTILQHGGEITASSDAKDSTGKIGRSLVVEAEASGATGLRNALRSALGDRVVLSDAGFVAASNPDLKKAEESLAAAKKRLEQGRVDFLPQAPALRQMEDDYLAQERAVSERRKAAGRVRLNVLVRPTLGG